MSYNHTSIKHVIDRINSSYFIPDIQRNYVWLQNPKTRKIEQLFDSLMRRYPIGSFLFWGLKKNDIESELDGELDSGKLNFQLYKFIERYDVRHPYNEKYNISQLVGDELHVVLDGQQRLTSLYIGLRGSRCLKKPYARRDVYEEKYLYLNLLHVPEDKTPDDAYMFEFKTAEEARQHKEGELWFRVGNVMNFNNKKEIRDYCQKEGYIQSAEYVLEDLWEVVVNDNDVIAFFEETEKDLDKVLKIFIRVNSGGMQLSYSDLLMSLLTAAFKSEIRGQMEEVVDHMREEGFSCFGRDQVLKTCMLLSGFSHVFKMENFSKHNIAKIEKNWDSIIQYLYDTTALIKSMGYGNHLSSGYIIAVICLYLYKKQTPKPSKNDRQAMVRFVQIAQIRGYFTTSLDNKLSNVKDLLSQSKNFELFVEELEKEPDFRIDDKYLEWAVGNVKYGSPAVLPLLQLLYPNLNYGSVVFHVDHIYPKSKFNKKTLGIPVEYIGKENELWNLQLLEGVANESKKDKDPEQWLKDELPDIESRKTYMNTNYIPENFVMEWGNIGDFETKRKEKILEKLMQVFAIQKR